MKHSATIQAWCSGVLKTCLSKRGTASVEFALIAPVLIGLAIGMVETVRYIRARSATFAAAAALADLVASQNAVTAGSVGTLHDACTGAGYAILPLPSTSLSATVASYSYPNGTAAFQKDWENAAACPTAGAAATAAMASTAALLSPTRGDSIIVVKTSYTYVPVVSSVLPSVTFQQVAFARPRFGTVICASC